MRGMTITESRSQPVLEETLGVMVFQEQLSQAAIHLAGFDPARDAVDPADPEIAALPNKHLYAPWEAGEEILARGRQTPSATFVATRAMITQSEYHSRVTSS